jgi:flagellar hook assembly protein FlgD
MYGGWLGTASATTTQSDLQLFPNPSTGRFTISGTVEGSGDAGIEVTDMLGRNVYQSTTAIKNGRIYAVTNLDGKLPAGSYTVKVSYANGNKVFHVVVN